MGLPHTSLLAAVSPQRGCHGPGCMAKDDTTSLDQTPHGRSPGTCPGGWPKAHGTPAGGGIHSREARGSKYPLLFPSSPPRWPPILRLDYAHSRGARSHLISFDLVGLPGTARPHDTATICDERQQWNHTKCQHHDAYHFGFPKRAKRTKRANKSRGRSFLLHKQRFPRTRITYISRFGDLSLKGRFGKSRRVNGRLDCSVAVCHFPPRSSLPSKQYEACVVALRGELKYLFYQVPTRSSINSRICCVSNPKLA